jgi:hypothetical protein
MKMERKMDNRTASDTRRWLDRFVSQPSNAHKKSSTIFNRVNIGENHASDPKMKNDTAKIKGETLSSIAENINPAQCLCGCN